MADDTRHSPTPPKLLTGLSDVLNREYGVSADQDLSDEADRYYLYVRLLDPADWQRFVEILMQHEPYETVTSSFMLEVLKVIQPGQRSGFVDFCIEHDLNGPYIARRSEGLDLSDCFLSDTPTRPVESLDGAEPWAQLRVAENTQSTAALTHLATSGSTKRIRRTANERLRPGQ